MAGPACQSPPGSSRTEGHGVWRPMSVPGPIPFRLGLRSHTGPHPCRTPQRLQAVHDDARGRWAHASLGTMGSEGSRARSPRTHARRARWCRARAGGSLLEDGVGGGLGPSVPAEAARRAAPGAGAGGPAPSRRRSHRPASSRRARPGRRPAPPARRPRQTASVPAEAPWPRGEAPGRTVMAVGGPGESAEGPGRRPASGCHGAERG